MATSPSVTIMSAHETSRLSLFPFLPTHGHITAQESGTRFLSVRISLYTKRAFSRPRFSSLWSLYI
jgi:hypothetical protein